MYIMRTSRHYNTHHSAPIPPGTRYATLGTPIGIILISFLIDARLDDPSLFRPDTAFGVGAGMPFFGTKVDT